MENLHTRIGDCRALSTQGFWGKTASYDHLVQIYDNDNILLDTLEGFTGSGLLANETVVVIATAEHLEVLTDRLFYQEFDLSQLISSKLYIPLDASDLLSAFLVNNRIDEVAFNGFMQGLLDRAGKRSKKIRVFGEMVAILWERGQRDATLQLEELWSGLHSRSEFTLFCAYPRSGFTESNDSIDHICRHHGRIIDGHTGTATGIRYKSE